MAIFELDPVDQIAVAAVGEPGQRRFYLQATGGGRTITLGCEKSQIQALLLRLGQLIEAQGIKTSEVSATGSRVPVPEPAEPDWQIAEIGLGYHETRGRFVLVASQAEAEAANEGTTSVRFWLSRQQVLAFSKQAETMLAAGRAACPRCGLPMDPSGHPCPVMNGARPIF